MGALAESLALLAAVAVLIAVIVVPALPWLRRRWRRADPVAVGRTPLDDGEFVRRLGASPTQKGLCLALRDELAYHCGIAPELICPADSLASLLALVPGGGDMAYLRLRLERDLQRPIPPELFDEAAAAAVDGGTAPRGLAPAASAGLEDVTVGGFALELACRLLDADGSYVPGARPRRAAGRG